MTTPASASPPASRGKDVKKILALLPEAWTASLAPAGPEAVDLVYREFVRFPPSVPASVAEATLEKTVAIIRGAELGCSGAYGRDPDGVRWWLEMRFQGRRGDALGAIVGELVIQFASEVGGPKVRDILVGVLAVAGTNFEAVKTEEIDRKVREQANVFSSIAFRRFPRPLRVALRVLGIPLFVIYRLRGGKFHRRLDEFLEQEMAECA